MSFISQVRTLKLSVEGKSVGPKEFDRYLHSVEGPLSTLQGPKLVLLQEEHPLRFILSFFCLLDKGHTPVSLPSDLSSYQVDEINTSLGNPARLIKGVFTAGDVSSPYPGSYASLTSGTTGNPRLCYFSVENALENARAHCTSLSITSDDEVLQTLPVYHSYGIVAYILSWPLIKFALDLNLTFLSLRALTRRTLSSAVLNISPAQLRFMLKEKSPSPPGIKLISIGGGPIDRQSLSEFSKKLPGVKLYVTYGLTEAGPRVTTGLWEGEEEGYIGKALPGVKVKVDSGKTGEGKLLISSPSLKLNLEESELRNNDFVTRDHVFIDTESKVYFRSREDDLINFGGISVYPGDIEAVARRFSGVLDAAAIKVPSKLYEEEPVLFIEPEVDVEELQNFLKERLTVYQMPKKILPVKILPRTSLNKVDRKILRTLARETE